MTNATPRTDSLHSLARSGDLITVRELISLWGAKGRGSAVREEVSTSIRSLGLATEPPFTYGTLDTLVRIVSLEDAQAARQRTAESERPSATKESSLAEDEVDTLHVGQIPSALAGITSVEPGTPIEHAQTLMIKHDYSQLPVMKETLVGVVSWESIAQASLQKKVSSVDDCMVTPLTVAQDADLLASIELIVSADYVIVLGPDAAPTGIVTTADLAGQFDRVARPFLTIGECERELRRLLDRHFDKDTLHAATKYKKKEKRGAAAMTIGDIKHFVDRAENWKALGLRLSREAFVEWVDLVRQLRNEIAHFNQDEDSMMMLDQVSNLTKFLRTLKPVS